MKVLLDPQILSGFIFEQPLDQMTSLTHCGEAICRNGHLLPPHRHSGFEFLLLTGGRAEWKVDGRRLRQEAGELLVVSPATTHSSGPTGNPENHHLWIGLELGRMAPAAKALGQRLGRQGAWLLRDCREAEPLLRGIVRQLMTKRASRREVVSAYIATFLALVNQAMAVPAGGPAPRSVPYSYRIQKAIALMEANPTVRLSLRDLAKAAGFRTLPHFCAQFRREVGLSPVARQLQGRIASARDALSQPGLSITAVAFQHGFSSSQHFSTAFRKVMACSPKDWRSGRRRP